MSFFRNLSLKIKLVGLLSFLTTSMLLAFAAIAIRDFEKDKITYVLDTTLSQTKSLSAQIRTEFSYNLDKIRFFTRGFDPIAGTFHPYTVTIFPGEASYQALAAYQVSDIPGQFKQTQTLQKTNLDQNSQVLLKSNLNQHLQDALDNEVSFLRPFDSTNWIITLRVKPEGQAPFLVLALISNSEFLRLYDNLQTQDSFLATKAGKIVMKPRFATYGLDESLVKSTIQQTLATMVYAEGVLQTPNTEKEKDLLIAVADPNIGELKLVSIVPKSAALEAVQKLIVKSFLFLGLLFSVTIVLSIFSSTKITASLKRLLVATSDISKGNFDVTVPTGSTDEIGTLASGFNSMTGEIRRLVVETAQKARMEGELKTARLVQSTLFPAEHTVGTDLEICGRYEPASECSGDWWYYERIGEQTLFCIGDATGHGVPAALLTAAARSSASALEHFPDLPIEHMMSIFNRSVYNTARGQVLMTLFVGLYDHRTGQVKYCNASHEPPYVMPLKAEVKKKDLILLNDVIGPRLGESLDATYPVATYDLVPGDRIVLYTDGVTDLKNNEGAMWGERSLIKCLVNTSNAGKDLSQTVAQIQDELTIFRQEHPLHDDVTYFIVTRKSAA